VNLNNITITHPNLIKEWHPSLNGDLRPEHVSYGSGKRIWWQCKKDSRHVWDAIISNRARLGRGCPFCVRKRVTKDESLGALYPDLEKEWDYDKNEEFSPYEIPPFSQREIYLVCPEGHSWKTKPVNLTRHDDSSPPRCN